MCGIYVSKKHTANLGVEKKNIGSWNVIGQIWFKGFSPQQKMKTHEQNNMCPTFQVRVSRFSTKIKFLPFPLLLQPVLETSQFFGSWGPNFPFWQRRRGIHFVSIVSLSELPEGPLRVVVGQWLQEPVSLLLEKQARQRISCTIMESMAALPPVGPARQETGRHPKRDPIGRSPAWLSKNLLWGNRSRPWIIWPLPRIHTKSPPPPTLIFLLLLLPVGCDCGHHGARHSLRTLVRGRKFCRELAKQLGTQGLGPYRELRMQLGTYGPKHMPDKSKWHVTTNILPD